MTQTLSQLFLDTSRIEDAVRNFDVSADVVGPTDRGKFVEYLVTQPGQITATLHVYLRDDTTTTLHTKVGKNQGVSQQIGEHVASHCKKKEFKQQPLSINRIEKSDWEWLINHLKDDHKYTVTEGVVPHGVRFDVVKKKGHDQVNINRYDTGRLLMQGKALEVYSVVAMALCDLAPDKRQVVEAQLKCYQIEGINAAGLLAEVKEWAPSAENLLGDTGAAILAPSFALMKLDIELPDYSVIAYPALRALETYMKALMAKHDQPVLNEAGFGNYFYGNSLKSGVRTKINCGKTVEAVEKSYALYNEFRHSLFHAEANPEFSRILELKSDAVNIVHRVLKTIEETAAAIPQ